MEKILPEFLPVKGKVVKKEGPLVYCSYHRADTNLFANCLKDDCAFYDKAKRDGVISERCRRSGVVWEHNEEESSNETKYPGDDAADIFI